MSLSTSQRRLFLGAAGLGALGLGVGYALYRGGKPALSEQAQAFWPNRFDRPEGGQIEAHSLLGRPLLLNFWATWCAPCVKEMPELDRFQREHPPWQVLGLAIDSPAPVLEFLRKTPVSFPIGMAGLTGTTLARTLGNPQGGLPFSVAFSADGEPFWYKLGATTLEELAQLAARPR